MDAAPAPPPPLAIADGLGPAAAPAGLPCMSGDGVALPPGTEVGGAGAVIALPPPEPPEPPVPGAVAPRPPPKAII